MRAHWRLAPGRLRWAPCLVGILLSAPKLCAGQPSWNDTLAFRPGVTGELWMLLEKTLFKVDVLTVRVRYDSSTTSHIEHLIGEIVDDDALRDSVALAVIAAQDVLVDIEFVREIRVGQFLDGIADDMQQAVRAGFLTDSAYQDIMSGLPVSFQFLNDRRIRKNDKIAYRIHGDTLRTVFRDAEGHVLLDQVDVGRERRLSVIATFLAPGSSFRKGLLNSLNDGQRLSRDDRSG